MLGAATPPLELVAYLALFAGVGLLFLFGNLLVGRFLRPRNQTPVKGQIYECGEPAIGSGFVQFDLRFYVVALVFIVFDVEVAFFFPWAIVFGKANHLASPNMAGQIMQVEGERAELTATAASLYRELGVARPVVPTDVPSALTGVIDPSLPAAERATAIVQQGARQLALVTLIDIGVFFAVLLIGFAYVWYRRDLDWVRSLPAARDGTANAPLAEGIAGRIFSG